MLSFIKTAKGQELLKVYANNFEGSFVLSEPGGLVLDTNDDYQYIVPNWETPEEFEAALLKSVKMSTNLFFDRYKDYKEELNDDFIY